jgi:hypothetical protein
MVFESFVGYRSLGWHLCSLRVYMTSAQYLLAFIVSDEKSGVILTGLLLYVTCPWILLILITPGVVGTDVVSCSSLTLRSLVC